MGLFFAVTFVFWRLAEIVTLIPTLGMLGYFVHLWVNANALTPTYIVLLFVVSVLATFYSIFTLFSYHRSRRNAVFISFLDLCFVGAFIASVYELRFITTTSCSSISQNPNSHFTISFGDVGSVQIDDVDINTAKNCDMLKACFAFGIMNCIFFFITSLLVACVGKENRKRERSRSRSRRGSRVVEETTTVRRSHSGRSHSGRSHRSGGDGRTYV